MLGLFVLISLYGRYLERKIKFSAHCKWQMNKHLVFRSMVIVHYSYTVGISTHKRITLDYCKILGYELRHQYNCRLHFIAHLPYNLQMANNSLIWYLDIIYNSA